MKRTVRRLLFVPLLVALVAGGCGAERAKSPATPSPLDVPSPPPRIVVPPLPQEPEVTKAEPPPGTVAPPKKPAPAQKATDPKAEPPATVEPPPTVATPPATLQQAQPPTAAETGKLVRDQLDRAKKTLEKIKPGNLNADERSQYDAANQFIAQATQALAEGNLVFAAKVAEKAVALAAGIPVR